MVEIKVHESVAPIHLLALRVQSDSGNFSEVVPAACGRIWNLVRELRIKDAGRLVSIYPNGKLEAVVGVEVPAPTNGGPELIAAQTPGGPAVCATHFGPYHELGTAYEAIQQWENTSDRKLGKVSWEVYGHWQPEWNDDPSLIRTDIWSAIG